MNLQNWLTAAVIVLALGGSSFADPIPIANHSFEEPDVTSAGQTWSAVNTNWGDDAGTSNDQFVEYIPGFAADGLQHIGIFDQDESGAVAPLFQNLTATYAPNTTYTLTVAVGHRLNFVNPGNEAIFRLADATSGMILAESIADASFSPANVFQDWSLTYTTGGSGDPIGNSIRIELTGPGGNNSRAHFDNIRLDATTIPEPTSIWLTILGLGLTWVVVCRRLA